ncbi:sialic acid-binding Ig-like lectin 10 [Dasypus novemcinctus]|uniref:sialic acid-binding Ig-like lectin 10 n=1 Tax=Dasypus novemcinctus TaxID=9361 RepID=UPI0003289E52|nr:sialic acid-binding Ig-like lectin 10 [Dasypus novemcinctus]
MSLPLLLLLPWLPGGSAFTTADFSLQVQRQVAVQEGLCILVPCSVFYPRDGWTDSDPAHGYWYRQVTSTDQGALLVATNKPDQPVWTGTRGRFQLVGDPRDKNCSLLIRNVQSGDRATYYFRVERGSIVKYSFLKALLSLDVTALTQKPDVYLPESLEPGLPATVVCVFNSAFEGCPAPTFSWTGAALSFQDIRPRTSYFSVLTFTPRPQDDRTSLTCHVDFSRRGVRAYRTVLLSVAYAPKDLMISVSHAGTSAPEPLRLVQYLEVQKGQFLRLFCTADSQPPSTLSWALEDRVLSWSQPWGSRALRLELRVGPGDGGRYTCRAENRLGSRNRTLELSVQYAPENLRVVASQSNRTVLDTLENGTSLPVLEGQSLSLLCVADSNPPARLSWARGNQTLSPPPPSDPGVLELPPVRVEDGGELTCRAENARGSALVSLNLSVLYPPQLLGPSCSWEADGLRCSCSARAHPTPSLRWRLGEGNSSDASFTATAEGPWASSNLSLRGELGSGLRLSCEARNALGAHSATVLLPGKKGLVSTAFSKGVFLGIGITTFLSLCLMLIIVKTVRKKRSLEETLRPRPSRGSSIMDYVNVIPNPISLARNQRAKPAGPSQTPLPGPPTEESKNRKELHFVSTTCPGPKSFPPAPESEASPEELHYAALNFPGLRTWGTQEPRNTQTAYAEIKFHRGSAEL